MEKGAGISFIGSGNHRSRGGNGRKGNGFIAQRRAIFLVLLALVLICLTITRGSGEEIAGEAAAGAGPAISITPKTKAFTDKGGSGRCTVSLTGWSGTEAVIQPSVTQGDSWLHLVSTAPLTVALKRGKGSAVLSYTVDATAGYLPTPSQGAITVSMRDSTAGATASVTRKGVGCKIAISPRVSSQFSAEGGTGSFTVTAPEGCEWQVSAATSTWVEILSALHGSGPSGVVQYRVSANQAKGTRTATIQVKANNAAASASYRASQAKGPPVYTVSIDGFGRGTVTDSKKKINCGPNSTKCSAHYDEGASVVLTAAASADWTLHHWTGCDTTNGSVCTITVTGDKVIHPTFVSTTVTSLHSNVIILDDQTVSLLEIQEGSTYIFDVDATAVAALQPGDIIVSKSGYGFARKVVSVFSFAGSAIFVDTADVTLEDIIKEGSLVVNGGLTSHDITEARPLLEGARLMEEPAKKGATASISLDSNVGPLHISGITSLFIEPDFAADVGLLDGIREFKSSISLKDETSLTLSSDSSFSFVDREIPLYSFTFAPIVAGPVVFVPLVDVNLVIKGNTEVGFSTGISFSQTASIGVHYRKSEGWSPVKGHSRSIDVREPTITGPLSLKGGIAADVNVLLYGVAGPYASFEAYLEAEASASTNGAASCVDWRLFLGAGAGVGTEVGILGWTLAKYEVSLFDYKWDILARSVCPDHVPPSAPQNLRATAVSSSDIQLTWEKSTDTMGVAGYLVFRRTQNIARTSGTLANDSNLKPGTQYCYSVKAFDGSDNQSAASATVCAYTKHGRDTVAPSTPVNVRAEPLSTRAISLSWDASTDDVAVAGYKIYRGSSPVGSTAGLTANDNGLSPSTSYCYTVVAYDEAGNTSPAGGAACATTKDAGGWTVYSRCLGRSWYSILFNMDLDESVSSYVHVFGTGEYYGLDLAFLLSGRYDSDSATLDGRMTWLFQANSCIRVDEFSAYLGSGESGDITMDQVRFCGCTSQIRFSRTGESGAAKPIKTGRKTGETGGDLFNSSGKTR
ncbi:MAG TPA: fibronectin type III domain-containing protein [Syntrophorhabdaceae bacterium]|jgi:hypothetical protein